MASPRQIAQALYTLCGPVAQEVARTSGLVHRRSKLDGLKFLQMWVWTCVEQPQVTLGALQQVAADLGLVISKSGLQQRLTPAAVTFLQTLFGRVQACLQNQVALPVTLLRHFTAVHLRDATALALPGTQALITAFPATGGNGPKAGMKLQVWFEWLRGNLEALWQTDGRVPDQRATQHLAHLVPGGLVLADLGYFVLTSLTAIAAAGAYFISRFETGTGVRDPQRGQPFDLLAHLQHLPAAQDHVELALLVGLQHRVPCRLLAVRLAPAQVAQRRRKAAAAARHKGRQVSAQKLAWLDWSVYVTNVPAAWLTLRQVVLVYALRWQVELLFKLWKSQGQIDHVVGQLAPRILCELYAKLIGLVLFNFLIAPLRRVEAERELSVPRAWDIFRHQVHAFVQAGCAQRAEEWEAVLTELYARWPRYALKGKRWARRTTLEQLDGAACAAASQPQGDGARVAGHTHTPRKVASA